MTRTRGRAAAALLAVAVLIGTGAAWTVQQHHPIVPETTQESP